MAGRKRAEPGEKVIYTPGGKLVTHGGSGNAYSNYHCRCRECMDANTDRYEKRRAERRAELASGKAPGDLEHGTDSTYTNWGCTCSACRSAHALKCAEYYKEHKKSPREGQNDA